MPPRREPRSRRSPAAVAGAVQPVCAVRRALPRGVILFIRHLDAMVGALRAEGCWWADDVLPMAAVAALRADLLAHRHALTEAAIGRGGERQFDPGVRADLTHWLDGSTAPQREYLDGMEQLRLALNRALILGLFDYEAHYALYPPGAHYARHVDAFHGASLQARPNRILSTVCYLNDGWQPGDGGELQLWNGTGAEVATLAPLAGRAVIFLSEEFPHAVLPTQRDRLGIAGWFRVSG